MTPTKLHLFFLIGLLLVSSFSYAQVQEANYQKEMDLGHTALYSDYKLAIRHFTVAQIIAKKAAHQTNEIDAILKISQALTYLGGEENLSKAFTLIRTVKEQSEKINYNKGLGISYMRKSVLHVVKGEYLSGLKNCHRALPILEQEKDTFNIIGTHQIKGMIFAELEMFESSVTSGKKALKLAQQSKNIFKTARLSHNIGHSYIENKKSEEALFYFSKVDSLIPFLKPDKKNILNIQNSASKASAYYLNGNYKLAKTWSLKSLRIHKENDYPKNDPNYKGALSILGKVYLAWNNLDKAAYFFYKLEASINNESDKYYEVFLAEDLSKLYKKRKEYKKAYEYASIWKTLSDSLKSEKTIKSINYLENEYQSEEKEKELVEQNLLIQRQKTVLVRNQKNIIILVLCGVFLVLVLLWFFHANQQKYKLNKALNEKTLKLEKVNTAKNMIFAIIGHDLRAPFTSIKSILTLAEEGIINGKNFQLHLSSLSLSVHNIESSLNNILLWAKNQMDGIVASPTDINLHANIEKSLSFLSYDIGLKKTKIIRHFSAATSIYCDENQFQTIIRNLISNAIKFTPNQGSITITTSVVDDEVKISIRDTGIGMDEKTKNNIFENDRFNAAKFGTNGEKGTGLGLKVCKEFTESNNGTIGCENIIGEGTVFFVIFRGQPVKPSLQLSV